MSPKRTYFVLTPQLVWARCENPHQFALWSVIKMVAGEDGTCVLGTRDLAALAMLGVGTVHQARQDLLRLGLLEGELCRDPGYPNEVWHLRIPDLWAANDAWREAVPTLRERIAFKRAQKRGGGAPVLPFGEAGPAWPPAPACSPPEQPHSGDERRHSGGERAHSPPERARSGDEPNKIPFLNPTENAGRSLGTAWENALAELAFQFPRAVLDYYLRTLRPGGWHEGADGPRAVLLCPSPHVQEWCRTRLDLAIRRVLGSILQRPDLAVEYRLVEDG